MPAPQESAITSLALEIWEKSKALRAGEIYSDDLPTSLDLARQTGLKHEWVKKRLKLLMQHGWVRATNYNPKRFQFDLFEIRDIESREGFILWLTESLGLTPSEEDSPEDEWD